jgi:aminoglycoside phosphotransferase (APT) family kinase protein
MNSSQLIENDTIDRALMEYCHRAFPQIVSSSIVPIANQGYLNRLYTAQHELNGKVVCRLTTNRFRDEHDYLSKEIWVQKHLQKMGIPVAKPLSPIHTTSVTAQASISFYFMEFVSGISGEVFAANESKRFQCYKTLGEVLKEAGRIQCTGQGRKFTSSESGFTNDWRGHLIRDFNCRLNCERVKRILPDNFERQFELLVLRAHSIDHSEKLCHGDPHLDNLLVDEQTGAVNAIIDWERAYSGITPICDIADVMYHQIILRATHDEAVLNDYLYHNSLSLEIGALLEGLAITAQDYQSNYKELVELHFLIRSLPFIQWWESNTDESLATQWQQTASRSIPFLLELFERTVASL